MKIFSMYSIRMLINLIVWLAMLTGGIILLIAARRKRQQEKKCEGAAVCSAQVADVRMTQQAGGFLTELALVFTGTDGMQHRAFLSVCNAAPLQAPVGSQIPVVVFPNPLTAVPAAAFDPYRGADGRLPEQVIPVKMLGVSLDETATVMLSADYPRFHSKQSGGSRTAFIIGILLTVVGAMRLLSVLRSFLVLRRYL